MASATWKVALTTIVEIALGRMWRTTDRTEPPPMTRDGLHELAGAQGQAFAPHQPGGHLPGQEGQHDDELKRAGRDAGRQDQQQEQRRHREDHVDDAHHDPRRRCRRRSRR